MKYFYYCLGKDCEMVQTNKQHYWCCLLIKMYQRVDTV